MEPLFGDERIDDLQFGGLRVIQSPSAFRFGMDAVLLADFAWIRPRDRVLDLGTGSAILPLLLHSRQPTAVFDAVEIDAGTADRAERSVALNGLRESIRIHHMDLREAPERLDRGRYDLVVCNPPYSKAGQQSRDAAVRVARHEAACTLLEILQTAGRMLRAGGRLAMVHHSDRALEVMDGLRENGMEPKRARLVYPFVDRPPNLALIEGMRQAHPGLHWLPPLIVRDPDGKETREMDRIYRRGS